MKVLLTLLLVTVQAIRFSFADSPLVRRMFIPVESSCGDEKDMKSSRSVVTKTVERTGGVRTTTTTFKASSREGIDAALAKLDIDPLKFRSGGSTVTKTIVYTDSAGHREVLEETTEDYGDPDQLAKSKKSKDTATKTSGHGLEDCRKGACSGKSNSSGSAKNDSESDPKLDRSRKVDKVGNDSLVGGQFEEECLKAHNGYRAKHAVPPLNLSKDLCAYAQEWADTLAREDSFRHRSHNKQYGENIYMKWSSDPRYAISGKEPVDSWYSEIKDFVFGREPTSLKSGHFTQVVWKESKTLGVGHAKSRSGKILVVANYDPAGNFIGRFAGNVPPLLRA